MYTDFLVDRKDGPFQQFAIQVKPACWGLAGCPNAYKEITDEYDFGRKSKTLDIRKAINKRKLFPTGDSARKVIYLAIMDASKKWIMPIRNWKTALNRFIIEFEDRTNHFL